MYRKDIVELPASTSAPASPVVAPAAAAAAAVPTTQGAATTDKLTDLYGVPPLSRSAPKASVAAKFANFHQLAQGRGLYFNDSLASSKAFRNPHIYKKLVDFVDVDESCTQFDPSVWAVDGLGPHATARAIGQRQKEKEEQRATRPAGTRSSIAFTTSSTARNSNGAGNNKDRRDEHNARDRVRERERDRPARDKSVDIDRDRDRDRHYKQRDYHSSSSRSDRYRRPDW